MNPHRESLCLCTKLDQESYDSITPRETEILLRAFDKAPHIFKQKRKKAAKKQNSYFKVLKESFPDKNINAALDAEGESWRRNPLSLLDSRSHAALPQQSADAMVHLCIALIEGEGRLVVNMLLRRVRCVALSSLHREHTSVEGIIQAVETNFRDSDYKREQIRNKVYDYLRFGQKWQNIITGCEGLSGVLALLGHNYSWERASVACCGEVIQFLLTSTELRAEASRYTPMVRTLIRHLVTDLSWNSSGSTATTMTRSDSPGNTGTVPGQDSGSDVTGHPDGLCGNNAPETDYWNAWVQEAIGDTCFIGQDREVAVSSPEMDAFFRDMPLGGDSWGIQWSTQTL